MIAALVILCVVTLALLVTLLLLARRLADNSSIKAQLDADFQTLLVHAALARKPAEVAAMQRASQPIMTRRTVAEAFRNTDPDRGDDMPEFPEGLGG